MIPRSKWVFYGHPLHLCVCWQCKFRLGTKVGKYVISTVGEYFPYSNPEKMDTVDSSHYYETMVFLAGGKEDDGCPRLLGSEKDCEHYNTAKEAHKGHYKMCEKWAKKQ